MDYSIEIKNLRESLGMNRKEFCEHYSIPYRTVCDWESNKRTMPDYVFRLLKYKAEIDKEFITPKELESVAYLSSKGEYTEFRYGDRSIRFMTSKNLDKYTRIVEWDRSRGYIVVMSKNVGKEEEEDYIDLKPILKNLLIDAETFLKPIKEVKIAYEY